MSSPFEEQLQHWVEMFDKHPDKIGRIGYGIDGYAWLIKKVDDKWGLYRENNWVMPTLNDKELNIPIKIFENTEDAMKFAIEKLNKDVSKDVAKVADFKKKLKVIANKLEKLNFNKEASIVDRIIVKLAADPPDTVLNALSLVNLTLEAIQDVDMDKAIDEMKKVKNYIQNTFDEALSEYDIHFEIVDKEKMDKEVVEVIKLLDNDEIRKVGKLFEEVQDKSKSKVEVQKLDVMENKFFNREEVVHIKEKLESIKNKLEEWQETIEASSRQAQKMDEHEDKK